MDGILLKTSRLILRHQKKSDIEFLVYLWTDEEMTKYTGGPRDRSNLIEEFGRIAEDPKKDEYDLWPVEHENTHELIGHAGFIPKEIRGKEYIELNYYIDRKNWGKGYAKEISKALVDYAFKEKKLDAVIAIINPENEGSKKVAESIGMKYWMDEERSRKIKSIYVIRREDT